MRIITFGEIVDFVGDYSRPLKEGSLAMNNIVSYGIALESDTQFEFFALCLSSTDPKRTPYEVNIYIKKDNNTLKCVCQCKAQNLGHCKHVIGFLMVLERTSLEDIQKILKTDMVQSWGRVSEAAVQRCEPCKIMNLCHVNAPITKYPPVFITPEVQEEIFKGLIEAFPESILAKTYSCFEEEEIRSIVPQEVVVEAIEFPILPSYIIEKLINEKPVDFDEVITTFIELVNVH